MSIIQQILPRDAIHRMIEACEHGNTYHDRRNLILVLLMGRCALRSIEARMLEPTNLRRDESGVLWLDLTNVKRTLRGPKGKPLRGRRRSIPCSPEVDDALTRWMREDYDASTYVLGGRDGRPLSKPTIWRAIRKVGFDAGLGDIHPHMLRHTCISDWMQSGQFSQHGVRAMTGHASTAQLDVYLHARPEDLAAGMRAV